MTNGEKLKEVFPSIELYEKSHDAIQINFNSVWWNAEYKEPTTKNDLGVDNQNIRLIDANALIKRLRPKHFDWWGEGEQDDFSKGNNSMLEEVIEAIEEFPSVIPIRPKGHWIEVELPARDAHECSKCGGLALLDENGNEQLTYFCPNCGVKMEEVKE